MISPEALSITSFVIAKSKKDAALNMDGLPGFYSVRLSPRISN
jgi:hypothetical protein